MCKLADVFGPDSLTAVIQRVKYSIGILKSLAEREDMRDQVAGLLNFAECFVNHFGLRFW